MKFTLNVIVFFFTTILFSQNELVNRKEYLLKLPIDNELFYKQDVIQSPYIVSKNVLQIYTGEKLFIEVENENNQIVSMRVVDENHNPE